MRNWLRRVAKHFQFTLFGLFVAVFGVAVGTAVRRIEPVSSHKQAVDVSSFWQDGVIAAITTWVVLGIVAQSRDL